MYVNLCVSHKYRNSYNTVSHYTKFVPKLCLKMLLGQQHKTKYYKEKIDDCSGDAVRMWKTLKELTNGKNVTCKKKIKFGENIISNEEIICNAFNDYFIESIEEISRDIIKDNNYNFVLENIEQNELVWEQFKKIDLTTLRKYVYTMPNKNSDTDGITTRILKIAFETIGNSSGN